MDNLVISLEPELTNGKKAIQSVPFSPRLVYYLDGSLRTKYLGEYIEGGRSFPILASEVYCAVVKKVERQLKPHAIEKRLSFIFPDKDTGLISDTIYERLKSQNEKWVSQDSSFRIEFLQREGETIRDLRYSMMGKARAIMHNLEIEVAQTIERTKDWLVIDGAIRKAGFLNLENTIGLAKSFSRKPTFDLGDGKPLMIGTYLSKVRAGQRSAIFMKEGGDVAFWYVRLRTYPPMEPLGGLVKVDLSIEEDELSKEHLKLIDELSAEIYALRAPSLYPLPRWPSLIYPIRLTELIMRSVYVNVEILGYYGRELHYTIK